MPIEYQVQGLKILNQFFTLNVGGSNQASCLVFLVQFDVKSSPFELNTLTLDLFPRLGRRTVEELSWSSSSLEKKLFYEIMVH